jgi:hypothetical protein
MKHAGKDTLDRLEPLLRQIREVTGIQEKTRGVFYLKSRAALHFHEDPAGLFADLRLPGEVDFERLRVDHPEGQSALLARLVTGN